MFARKITTQQKLMMLLVFVPLYYYCGSIIASALMYFVLGALSLKFDVNTLNAYLNLFADLFFVAVIVLIFKDSLKEQWNDFKKNIKENLKYSLVIGFLLLFGFNILGGMITLLLGGDSLSQNQSMINELLKDHVIVIAFVSVFCAPIVEELLFRGTIFAWAYEFNSIFAHCLSAFLFGFIHIMQAILAGNSAEWIQVIPYTLMGFALSYLYEKRNNIFVPMLVHGAYNFISIIIVITTVL